MGKRLARFWCAVFLVVLAACARDESPMAPEPDVAPAPSAALTPASALGVPTGNVVIVFKSETSIPAEALALVASLGGALTSRHDEFGVVFAKGINDVGLQTLRQSALVEAAGPDYLMDWLPEVHVGDVVSGEAGQPNADPTQATSFKTQQWGPQRIAAHTAWAAGFQGDPSIRVAILDTGIDFLHVELQGKVDLDASASFVAEEPTFDDYHFHGTHVASTVSSNNVRTAGVAPGVTLIAVKVLSATGSGTFEGVIAGIRHAADVDAHVINMSLGAVFSKNDNSGTPLVKALARAVEYAGRRHTLVVSAAGNDGMSLDGSGMWSVPCMVSHVCVSATGPLNGGFSRTGPILTKNHDRPSYYTNYGINTIHVAAPGGNLNPSDPDQVRGTWKNTDLILAACAGRSTVVAGCQVNNPARAVFAVFAAGTSMATPHVSGAAALIQASARGKLTVDQVKQRLLTYADDVGVAGRDAYSNYGRINVYRAIRQQ